MLFDHVINVVQQESAIKRQPKHAIVHVRLAVMATAWWEK